MTILFATTALISLCLAPTTAAAEPLAFDWPDPSQKLNLSAPLSLDYKYSRNKIFDNVPNLDVLFHYRRNYTEWLTWTEPIIMDHILTGGNGTVRWDPSEFLELIQEEGHFLTAGREHRFEVKRHEKDSNFGMAYFSEYYAVEARKAVDSAARLARPMSSLLVLLGLGVTAVGVL
ncbi:hypothetical protein ACHAQA_007010 [Verticillium albo-atrum]